MGMHNSLLQALFGCQHGNTTFPLTPIRRSRNTSALTLESPAQTYIACLDCGQELPYDWEKMQRVKTARLSRSISTFRRLATQRRLRSVS